MTWFIGRPPWQAFHLNLALILKISSPRVGTWPVVRESSVLCDAGPTVATFDHFAHFLQTLTKIIWFHIRFPYLAYNVGRRWFPSGAVCGICKRTGVRSRTSELFKIASAIGRIFPWFGYQDGVAAGIFTAKSDAFFYKDVCNVRLPLLILTTY